MLYLCGYLALYGVILYLMSVVQCLFMFIAYGAMLYHSVCSA